MKKIICIVLLSLLCMQLFTVFCFASENTIPDDELVSQVDFSFSAVDQKYSITISNHTEFDILKIKIAEIQRQNETEKPGTFCITAYPIGINEECAVPAGETVTFSPSKVLWNDCNNMVNYVYYIEFSDGSKWGSEYSLPEDIFTYALRFDVPYSVSSVPQKNAGGNRSKKETRKNVNETILGAVAIMAVVALVVFFRCRKKPSRHFTGSEAYPNCVDTDPSRKGRIGEYITYDLLDRIPGEKRLLHNIYIPKADGTTTEIDCLLIHQKGLFVMESKNYKGYIYGSRNDSQWTQVLRKNRHYSFYNPILQNNGHIKNLLTYLSYQTQDRYRKIPVYSMIVFSDTADITKVQTEGLPEANIYVINANRIISTICEITQRTTETILTEEDVTEIYGTLLPLASVTDEIKKKHIENIKKY